MSAIKVTNLTFNYDTHPQNIFEDVSFIIDTKWKLGFVGRNGKGKTTFLKLLMGQYDYRGKITSDVTFDYFPFQVENTDLNSYEIANFIYPDFEIWKLDREVSLMDMDTSILNRPFNTLSKGEQTKVLLGILFTKNNNFLLIDEPTNHLDYDARNSVANYLQKKNGFILVSHDRAFLDKCVDHILSINRANIEIQQGNFSSWYENKIRQDNYELAENEKLKREITRLEKSARQTAMWSDKVEASKYKMKENEAIDRGYIGHQSAKMMKRALVTRARRDKAIEEKSKLLKNIEVIEDLKLSPLVNRKGHLIEARNLSISYKDNAIFDNISFTLENGDRLQLKGKNGCGKSSIIKLLLGDNIAYSGDLFIASGLKISYISQDTSMLKGPLTEYIKSCNIDEPLFKAILRKLDFEREQFEKSMDEFSEGQKKKVLIARSLCESANLYIWDEPLNYIDIFSRMQIESLLLEYKPTMIFVEHDQVFSDKVATKELIIKRNKE